MDREPEEMQFLGFFGICNEAGKIIFSWTKIFTQITLTLILPLAFIFLAHIEISHLIYLKIMTTEVQLDNTKVGTKKYGKLSDMISSELIYYWLFRIVYLTFFIIFSLLSTAAVVYTIASVYTAREVTFKKIMSVVPKVWKRIVATFLWIYGIIFAYNVIFFVFFLSWFVLFAFGKVGMLGLYVMLFVYFIGLVYMSLIWQLSSVVSVLEDASGIKAMVKSKNLMKGKMWVVFIVGFLLSSLFYGIQIVFETSVVYGHSVAIVSRFCFGVMSLVLLTCLFLFGLVIQTVLYFVCKSYHHENIDKSALSDHLEVYLGEYVPLKSKDVQLEQV